MPQIRLVAGNAIVDQYSCIFNGVLVDPATVKVQYHYTWEQTTSADIVLNYAGSTLPGIGIINRVSTGLYQVNLDTTNQPGYWWWQWTTTGTGAGITPSSALIYPPADEVSWQQQFGDYVFGTGKFGGLT